MKSLLITIAIAIAFSIPAAAAPAPVIYELSCPAGYSPLSSIGKTFNQSTGMWRANICVSDNGHGTMVCNMNGCNGIAENFLFSALLSSSNSTAALHLDNGATLDPLHFARLTANSLWMRNTDPQPSTGPTWSVGTSGTILASHHLSVAVTFTSALGETTPSGKVAHQCAATNNCSGSVTAPTLPAGFTSYTVYAEDDSNVQSLQKITGCVNITGTCNFGSIPTTTAPPTTNPIMPAPANALTSECPPNVTPGWWIADASGNMHSQAYLSTFFDNTNGPPSPGGTLVFCRRVWFSDQQVDPPPGKNAMVLMNHNAGVGTALTNQDRTLWLNWSNPANDSTNHYGGEDLQAEMDFNCNGCVVSGNPDGEMTTASLQFQDNAVTNYTPTLGSNVIRAQYFKAGTGATASENILHGIYTINDPTYGFTLASGLKWELNPNTGGTVNNLITTAVLGTFNNANISAGQIGLYMNGQAPGGSSNFVIRNDVPGVPSVLNGMTTLAGLNMNTVATMPINASATLTGALTLAQSSLAGAASAGCTGGSSTYSYVFVGVDSNGGQAISPTQNTGATCPNPLTSGTPATLTITNNLTTATQYGTFVRIDVYRTAGPMATGKIASLTCSPGQVAYGLQCSQFSDTGLSASGTLPTINTTGGIAAYTVQHKAVTFANLPACASGLEGMQGAVTDSTTATWGATITGTGSNHVLGYCDGTNWTVAGK
jgi:hypothetical protein